MSRWFPFGAIVCVSLVFAAAATSQNPPKDKTPRKVQFARDILPILSANCLVCHGQDDKARKAGLRLDLAETATKALKSGSRAVVPGLDLCKRDRIAGGERQPRCRR